MGVNQVKFGDATVMDISDSTVTPETLLNGVTAYNKAGNKITGDVVVEHVEVEPVLETGTKSATITVGEESADIYCENTKAEVKNMKTTQSATITNGIAQFECIDKNFVKSLKLTMNPIQDLHGYDYPWAGGAGKNKCNPSLLLDQVGWNTFTIQLKANTQYTMSSNISQSTAGELPLYFMSGSATPGSGTWVYSGHPVTMTTDTDGEVRIQQRRVSGTDSFQNYQWQLEEGNQATSFAPYENICPISGRTEASVTRTGKNLFDFSNTDTTNGYVENKWLNSNGNELNYGNWNIGVYTRIFPNTQYTISGMTDSAQVSDGRGGYCFYDDSKTYISGGKYNSINQVVLTPNNAKYIRVSFLSYSYSSEYPQLELGSTATAYEPYTAETYTHQYSETIYGGTDDFVNGGTTSEYGKIVFNGTESWIYSVGRYQLRLNGIMKSGSYYNDDNVLCSSYPKSATLEVNNTVVVGYNSDYIYFYVTEDFPTLNDWRTRLQQGDIELTYLKATPTTISTKAEKITTIAGTNVITATEPISECSYRVLEENLSDTIYSNETLVGEDSDVYILRTAPDISDANYVEENVIGGTVAWNQLAKAFTDGNLPGSSLDNWYATSGTATASSGICTLTPSAQYGRINQYIPYVANHKILIKVDVKLSNSTNANLVNAGAYGLDTIAGSIARARCAATTEWQTISFICYSTTASVNNRLLITDTRTSDWGTIQVKNYVCHDLTSMFGSTIADYIYTLEQATSGAGIKFLQSHGFFTKDYYNYDAGSLQSVNFNKWFKTSKNLFNLHRLQGVTNIIDGNDVYVRLTKNGNAYFQDYQSYIPGDRTYTLQFDPPSDLTWTYASVRCRLKDNSDFGNVGAIDGWTYQSLTKNYRQSFENASHVEITVTIPDCLYCEFGIGVNNSFDNIKETGTYVKFSNIQLEVGSEATDYEPYEGYEISLDDNLDLRGLFRIADNKLIADGDIYEGDGKITRKYAVVDLGTRNWTRMNLTVGSESAYLFYTDDIGIKKGYHNSNIAPMICNKYQTVAYYFSGNTVKDLLDTDKSIAFGYDSGNRLNIRDDSYTDAESFKTAMSGVYLVYELAEPILNRGTNFDSPQVFIPNGNEYFVKTYTSTPDRDIDIPAGHVGKYYGKSMFKEISLPTIPKSGGTYILKCNVLADGNKKLYWCADGD